MFFSSFENIDYQFRCSCETTFPFTGKERDRETGFSYFGARYYDSDLSGLFLSVDPMSDKYPSLSPYAYCAWNPVKLVDPDGKKIKISGNITYVPNMSSENNKDFDRSVINALNYIYTSEEGALMINKLCETEGDIDIYEDFNTYYQAEGLKSAYYNETEGKPGTGLFSEITINWNIRDPESIPTLDGMQSNATYNLLDEICHAYDLCTGYGTDATFGEGYSKSEFQAVYRSNVVRHQLKDYNYRSQYYTNSNYSRGDGPVTARKKGNENSACAKKNGISQSSRWAFLWMTKASPLLSNLFPETRWII